MAAATIVAAREIALVAPPTFAILRRSTRLAASHDCAASEMRHRRMRIFFSVGEPSGDLARRQLDPPAAAADRARRGRPGRTEDASRRLRAAPRHERPGRDGVLSRAGQAAASFWRLLAQVERSLDEQRPDAVVLIDYPGFNWHVARHGEGARHSGFLLRPAAALGLGLVAREESAALRRSRAVQAAVRGGLVQASRAATRRTSAIPISMSCASSGSMRRLSRRCGRRRAAWSRFCPARGRRRCATTCRCC